MRVADLRDRRRRTRLSSGTGKLRLTSMMDILTVLLLFLLKSFVVEGEALTPTPGVELPESTSQNLPQESIHISVVDAGVLVGDQLVIVPDDGELWIPDLGVRLDAMRAQSEDLARHKGVEAPPAPRVTVQGDRNMEFERLERVMYTLSQSGYPDVSLAVIKTS